MIILEKFHALPVEKQNVIVDAALSAFGRNGYKKASMNDIATTAGISKAMMFYYFGSKKELYEYLVEVCGTTIIAGFENNLDPNVTDYFDRIKMITKIKITIIKEHHDLFAFLSNLYYGTEVETIDITTKLKTMSSAFTGNFVFGDADMAKFKEGIDPKIIYKFLIWASEGFARNVTADTYAGEIDAFVDEFYKCLDFMKQNFYKEEYL